MLLQRSIKTHPLSNLPWVGRTIAHVTGSSGTARLDDRGRVVLPAEVRRRLEMHPGDELVVTEEAGGALRLQSRRSAARTLIGLAGHLEVSAVGELRAQRHRDTAADTDR